MSNVAIPLELFNADISLRAQRVWMQLSMLPKNESGEFGLTRREMAKKFGICVSTLRRALKQLRESGFWKSDEQEKPLVVTKPVEVVNINKPLTKNALFDILIKQWGDEWAQKFPNLRVAEQVDKALAERQLSEGPDVQRYVERYLTIAAGKPLSLRLQSLPKSRDSQSPWFRLS